MTFFRDPDDNVHGPCRKFAEHDGQLEASIQWNGHAGQDRVRSARGRVGGERIRVREDVVGHDEPTRLEQRCSKREQLS